MFNLSDAFIVSPGLQTELRKEAVVQLIRFRPSLSSDGNRRPLKTAKCKTTFLVKEKLMPNIFKKNIPVCAAKSM